MFIGAGMDEAAIVALLDQALLSDEEMVREPISRAERRHMLESLGCCDPLELAERHSLVGRRGPDRG